MRPENSPVRISAARRWANQPLGVAPGCRTAQATSPLHEPWLAM